MLRSQIDEILLMITPTTRQVYDIYVFITFMSFLFFMFRDMHLRNARGKSIQIR